MPDIDPTHTAFNPVAPKRSRGRLLKPLAASVLTLTAGGWAALEHGLFTPAADEAVSTSASTLDAIERAWEGGDLADPASRVAAKGSSASGDGGAVVDPFLAAASSDEMSVVARGQEPRGGALDVEVAAELPAGNPLRGRYAPVENEHQQALARRFGGERYAAPSHEPRGARADLAARFAAPAEHASVPIRVDLGPESRVQPAAAEEALPADAAPVDVAPVDALAEDAIPVDPPATLTPIDPPVLSETTSAAAEEAFRNSPPAAPEPPPGFALDEPAPLAPAPEPEPTPPAPPVSPLVDMPIEPPVIEPPAIEPTAPLPADERVAALPRVYGSSRLLPPSPAPVDQGPTQTPAASFGGVAESTPAAPRPGDAALEGRQQPSLAIQKFAPETAPVGVACKFLIKVRNDSPRAVADVVVNDRTPTGARLVATTPTAETSGDAVRWAIGTLGPGEERTLEMEVVPEEEGEIGSVATVSFAAQASVKTSVTRPLLALRLSAPERVMVGQEQRLRIEVRNPGSGDATNVVLVEDVPSNLTHEAGPTLEFEVGTLKAGETRQLELVMNAEAPGEVRNLLTARADGGLEVRQSVEFEVVAPALTVAVQGPSRRYLQRPATYKVRVDNPGTAAARDIRLTTRLPRGMKFVKANNLGEYDPSTHAVYWALAELPEGAGGEVELTAIPTAAGEMTIEAEGEAQPGLKDTAAHRVRVEGIAAVDFEVLDVEDPIEVGGQTEYEVRVDNQGTKEATGVRVRFVAPPGMRVVSANGPSRHTIDSRGVAFEPVARLAPRAENRYRVRVQADEPGDLRMTVEVTTDDLTQPVRKEEATRVFGDE